MAVSSTTFSSHFQPSPDRPTRGKAYHTLLREAIEAETGKDMGEFFKVLVRKALGEEGAPYMKMLMDRVAPSLKAHMLTVRIEHFPVNGSATEQAESILKAVAQGVLPLDYAGPMLAMIQLIDAAKGGSLGNSGLDLSALYAGTGDGMKVATDLARQIAAMQPKAQVIDITPTPQQQEQQSITDAIDAQATQILDAIGGTITDKAHAQSLLDASTKALAARFPSNTYDSINAALVKVLNARLTEATS